MKKGADTRQTLMAVGNWLWSMFTINIAWFLINFPVILTLILTLSIPTLTAMIPGTIILGLMVSLFTLPSLTAVFEAVDRWQTAGDGTYCLTVLKGWRRALNAWPTQIVIAATFVGLLLALKATADNVLLRSLIMAWLLALLLIVIARAYTAGTQQTTRAISTFILKHGIQLVLATVVFVLLIGMNIFLKLAFMLLIASVSLAALVSYKLLNGFKLKTK